MTGVIDAVEFRLIHRPYNRTTDLMTMADGGYDPMGHIQTGRPHAGAYYLYQAAAIALEQQQHQQQQQQQQEQQRQQLQQPPDRGAADLSPAPPQTPQPQAQSQPRSNAASSSDDGHENNNNLPAAANNNLFRSEQKKHKRKRLSAVLDKLHNGGTAVVNHNNNNVGDPVSVPVGFALKCGLDSRSSAEDSATEDIVFPYSASPRISISPLRLSEVDENRPLPQKRPASKQDNTQQPPAAGLPAVLPSPSQRLALQPSQIKQEQLDQQHLYKNLQYFNSLALFLPDYLPDSTKLLYQEFARQRSHSDSDLHQPPQAQPPQQQPPQQPTRKKKKSSQGSGKGSQSGKARERNGGGQAQEQPLDLSMKSSCSGGSGRLGSPLGSCLLSASPVIKLEPNSSLSDSPPPPSAATGSSPVPPKLIVKREDCGGDRHHRKPPASPYATGHLNGLGGHHHGFNLNVSPVVEEMPPGSDVAYMCPVCGQLFSLQDRLAKHMASRHKSRTGATDITKSYMCEVCQRSFARSDMLTRHMRLHTGVKPYSCKVCGQIFSRSDHLSTHQRTHTGEKPYKCPQCPYAACRRDMITRHMRTHTRYESQRGGGPGLGHTSPLLMDQKPIMLPLVSLGSSGRSIKKELVGGGGFGATNYVLETKTES
ncbi:zinc finger protein 74-like [Anopheles cruzii]|uniref:zinc finger protein 74-like n=1 Tax=Anopheles cruzii TaxID=68878 RepID=UPI0022EC4A3F|nr:zinc finger protein 74-like [Anopheles cruzii]